MQHDAMKSLCGVVAKICRRFDSRITCEITDQIADYESTERTLRKQFGDRSNGKPNIGQVHVHIFIPEHALENEEVGVLSAEIQELPQIARVFASFGRSPKRIEGSVRSDDPGNT